MAALVTLERARSHLRIDSSSDDAELALKVEDATDIVLDYLKRPPGSETWVIGNCPPTVRAAVLLVLGALWENREGSDTQAEPLSPPVLALLHRHRDPAMG